jgi:beta-lactamase superfamily II metal-dependent hydrolase
VKSKDNRNNEAMSADQTFTTAQSTQSTLSVHFIDVGQGDAILIDFGNTEVLIDGGSSTPGVVGYLSNYIEGIPCTIMIKVKKRLLKK